jgi:GDPmannose 4,6-dehydratase
MHLMLQQDDPGDYVVATGETHTIQEFLDCVLEEAGLDMFSVSSFEIQNLRPAEVNELRGDARKVRAIGWSPMIGMKPLARIMYEAALASV